MKALILPNFKKQNCFEIVSEAAEILKNECVIVCALDNYKSKLKSLDLNFICENEIANEGIDFALTVGGDGTIIRAANLLLEHNIPIIGINLGTLGFLAGIEKDELYLLREIVAGNYKIEERTALHISIKHTDGKIAEFKAINDIVICKNAFAGIVDLKILCEDIPTAHYKADGVIVSTASGSTAYAMAAGGPIMHPDVKGITITPICAHTLHSRTIVLPEYENIKIETDANSKKKRVFAIADGIHSEEICSDDIIEVSRYSKNIRFITLKGKNFYSAINNKLMER